MNEVVTAAVIIPARNEERRIATCLSALASQVDERVAIVVVANNCNDGTADAARGGMSGHCPDLLDCTLDPSQGVGEARRRGCLHALLRYPRLRFLMTTDADCVVAPDWIGATLRHLSEVDAVCGRVDPIPSETAILAHMPSQEGTNEATYRDLVLRFYDLLSPESHNPYPHHGEAAGASLACRASSWVSVGGFADLRTGEDRDFVRRLRTAGFRVRHADDVRVQASCRLRGRAPGGMADALRERLAGVDYLVDESLPAVDDLIEMADRGRLDVWPPDMPLANRLRPVDLPDEIGRLQNLIERLRAAREMTDAVATIGNTPLRRIEIPPAAPPEVQPDV